MSTPVDTCCQVGKFDSNEFDKDFFFDFQFPRTVSCIWRSIPWSGEKISSSISVRVNLASFSFDSNLTIETAAPYVSQRCSQQLNEVMGYVDFFFSNLDEAISFADMKGYNVSECKCLHWCSEVVVVVVFFDDKFYPPPRPCPKT